MFSVILIFTIILLNTTSLLLILTLTLTLNLTLALALILTLTLPLPRILTLTRSLLLTLAGLFEILFSVPLAMFLWMLCGQVHSKLESLLTYTHPITCPLLVLILTEDREHLRAVRLLPDPLHWCG